MTTACGEFFFFRVSCVACVRLTLSTIFLVVAFFIAKDSWWVWWLYFLHYQLFYTNLFAIRKWLVYKHFIPKVSKLPVYLPWPSIKQKTIFLSVLTRSLSSQLVQFWLQRLIYYFASTWFFWRSSTSVFSGFCTFFQRASFPRCLSFCPILCFGGWNERPSKPYQRFFHSWPQFCI